jgi:alkane 1-monooxygenase
MGFLEPKKIMFKFRFLKYLTVFSLPATVYLSFMSSGIITYFPVLFFFAFVPILELCFDSVASNLKGAKKEEVKNARIYDFLLYMVLPIQYGFLFLFLINVQDIGLNLVDRIGMISSMGLMCGVLGINIGHELGHRVEKFDRAIGELLLLSSLNTHFLPYHNVGHHKNVATPKDPATARKGEPVFTFWIRSNFSSYQQAWVIEMNRLKKFNQSFFSFHNRMLIYHFAQLSLLITIFLIFGVAALLSFLAAASFGVLLLETVNYIEHYGLLRNVNDHGIYERVKPWHSWNSDHMIGRVILFELSRHSDHHYLASKKYQILDSFEESPQMPTGYPGMMLLSLVPPLWFKVMNPRVDIIRSEH